MPFFPENQAFSLKRIAAAKTAATRFLKKLFWINEISPAARTHTFISAKQKADMIMKMIPLYLPAIFTPLSQQLKKCYTKFIATVQDGGKTGVKTGIKHAYKQSALWVCFCPCFHIGQRAP